MTDFSAMRSIGAGLGLVRREPRVVAVWASVIFSLSLAEFALSLAFPLHAQGTIGGHPAVNSNFSANLILILRVPFTAMLWLAALRAFLHPGDRAFAYLRFGGAEARLVAYLLLAGVIGFVVLLLGVFASTAVIFANRWGANFNVFFIIESLPLLAICMGAILFLVRYSLAPALLLDHRPHPLDKSWKMTRQIYWPLVGALIAIAAATWIVALPILAVELFKIGSPTLTGGGLRAWAAAAQQSVVRMHAHPLQSVLSPVRLCEFLLGAVTKAVSSAVSAGVIGSAYGGRRPDG